MKVPSSPAAWPIGPFVLGGSLGYGRAIRQLRALSLLPYAVLHTTASFILSSSSSFARVI